MRWRIFDGALNTDILIDFLRRLIKGARKKLFLILDNLRVHHAKPAKAWLAEDADAIEVFYMNCTGSLCGLIQASMMPAQ